MDMASGDKDLNTGSIEGDGVVLFGGGRNLKLGNNNLDTVFSGVIQGSGSLTKIGTGTLTLSGANTYHRHDNLVRARCSSATPPARHRHGAVTANGGTLGGGGIISGAVTVGHERRCVPRPGLRDEQTNHPHPAKQPHSASRRDLHLHLQGEEEPRRGPIWSSPTESRSTAPPSPCSGKTQGRMKRGTVLTVISNTSANPISGTFSNLADGAIVNVNGNNLQASYSGGDGNDLTLTVVP